LTLDRLDELTINI